MSRELTDQDLIALLRTAADRLQARPAETVMIPPGPGEVCPCCRVRRYAIPDNQPKNHPGRRRTD